MNALFTNMKAAKFWMSGLLFVLLGFALWQTGSMIVIFLSAIVFAIFIESLSGYLEKLGVPRFLSIVIVFVGILALLGLLLASAIPVFIKEITALKPLLPEGDSIERILKVVTSGTQSESSSFLPVSSSVVAQLTSSTKDVSQGIFRLIVGTFGGFANLVLLGMLSLYLALEDRAIERLIRALAPRKSENYIVSLWNRIRSKTEGWFRSQLVIALIVTVVTYVGLSILGLPYAFLLSLLSGVLGIIPFGIVVAFLPTLGIAFAHGGVLTPVYVTLLYGILQYLTDYIIQPLLTRRSTGLPPLLVIISLVLSVTLAGFLGFFLAIPAAIFLLEFVRDLEQQKNLEAKDEEVENEVVTEVEQIVQ